MKTEKGQNILGSVMVVGGGIAGMQSALTHALHVVIVQGLSCGAAQ